ncbi:Lipoyltransferase and lipoate-protein ligase [Marasmius fiardii PR-910]|nr:Lipoyltransferase and lipoate-protein ligase [Marasmius fiardii PR-910]
MLIPPATSWLRCARKRVSIASSRFISSSSIVPDHSIYISESTDPYFNLSFEDWLFRHKSPHQPLLLLYRDKPCVIIGRHQNPWKEVNFDVLRARRSIPFVRRRSGGGTVYHDLGNTNFSIHLPRGSFDRHATAQVVLRAVRSLGIDANVNDRNDICIFNSSCFLLYVSGSAYRIVNKRAYHHGTMLISTELETLGDLLRTQKDTMETKGVASVRSPVCNLQQFLPGLGHKSFTDAVVQEFQKEYKVLGEAQLIQEDGWRDLDYIKRGMSELQSWEWAYGQTPEFTYSVNHEFSWGRADVKLWAKHGVILDCDIHVLKDALPQSAVEHMQKLLVGGRYGFISDDVQEVKSGEPRWMELWNWLQNVMAS